MREELREPPDVRMRDRVVGGGERAGHGDHEEEQIGDDDAPQTRRGRVENRRRSGEEHDLVLRHAQQHAPDLDRGERDRRHDHHVEEDAQVDGPESAQERGGRSRVAQLVESDVGQHPERRQSFA
jgi:hypothetical protein